MSESDDALYYVYNNLGYTNLELATQYTDKKGCCQWGKRAKYEEVMSFSPLSAVPSIYPLRRTVQQFMSDVMHRSIADVELMIDVDDLRIGRDESTKKFEDYEFNNVHDKLKWILHKLRNDGLKHKFVHPEYWIDKPKIRSIYWSGNKGYHISVIVPFLRQLNHQIRKQIKQDWLVKLGGDTQKNFDGALISLEGKPHRSTGKLKRRVK